MIVPQPQDISIEQTLTNDFLVRFSNLNQNFSPILPLHFNKSYLPKNLCERQLIQLFKCTIFDYNDQPDFCSYELASFQQCRKMRDIRILQGIKEWETDHVKALDSSNRQLYLQGLTFKLNRLREEYEKMPSSSNKQIKLHQLESQIQQIKWRMKYINTVMKQQKPIISDSYNNNKTINSSNNN